ncbi:MAG: hypothetical protein DRN03_00375 [Thermoplasmata archaeon]|nr:MAG: hypothetical protein DRN03_00375 [Thermoplasmata archaeon]
MKKIDKPILFGLENCKRCEYVKEHIPEGIDIEIKTYPHDMKEWSVDQLTEAVFYEVYTDLQKTAPILLLPDGRKLKSVIEIKRYLRSLKRD